MFFCPGIILCENTMNESDQELYLEIAIGEPVFDANGNKLGRVRGLDRAGFYVRGDSSARSSEPVTSIRDITGTAYVMWRCWNCGEMGRIEGELPESCPSCDGPREDLYYWAED